MDEDFVIPGWVSKAACAGMDPEVFFPTRGQSAEGAKAVCGRCPVCGPCRQAGSSANVGIWGGLSQRDRLTGRRQAAAAAA
ncbi:MAG: WhiB family transcriptional regulator [Acidimicrobiales bacterium]